MNLLLGAACLLRVP